MTFDAVDLIAAAGAVVAAFAALMVFLLAFWLHEEGRERRLGAVLLGVAMVYFSLRWVTQIATSGPRLGVGVFGTVGAACLMFGIILMVWGDQENDRRRAAQHEHATKEPLRP
ncbi:MAG: hypothetical protein KY455_01075 [Euryarchaeota archaeon]|nr:hypothetical protein [Euryarchaeota archaeon]